MTRGLCDGCLGKEKEALHKTGVHWQETKLRSIDKRRRAAFPRWAANFFWTCSRHTPHTHTTTNQPSQMSAHNDLFAAAGAVGGCLCSLSLPATVGRSAPFSLWRPALEGRVSLALGSLGTDVMWLVLVPWVCLCVPLEQEIQKAFFVKKNVHRPARTRKACAFSWSALRARAFRFLR